eukprot:TRINITY_DN18818_c0_g1_i3.p1 TRINITY_DN18818_c0_g1~~TRINITY_DN18818_c0_g1_i3.p1  ORF type:complete len:138 (+),score=40.33 TRINITY_DN18818_c0_g1_i3:74-487(+)
MCIRDRPIALAQVAQLRKRLDPSIDIVGVGGVTSGSDAFELILCGAAAVQVATTHWLEGPGCFDRIASELEALMAAKGYSTIEDFKGKLKPYDPKNRPAAPKSKTKAAPIAWAQWLLVLILPILAVLMQRELARQTL